MWDPSVLAMVQSACSARQRALHFVADVKTIYIAPAVSLQMYAFVKKDNETY